MTYQGRQGYDFFGGAKVRMVESSENLRQALGGVEEWKMLPEGERRQGVRGDVWRRRVRARRTGGSCRHVPHREKAPLAVARRNARERRRVEAVNGAFLRLRRAVPADGLSDGATGERGKRVSKVKTLHRAIEYITRLQSVLREAGCEITVDSYDTRSSYSQSTEDQDMVYDDNSDTMKWRGAFENGYRETQIDCVFGVMQSFNGEY